MKYVELLVEDKSSFYLETVVVRDYEIYMVESLKNFRIVKELRTIEV